MSSRGTLATFLLASSATALVVPSGGAAAVQVPRVAARTAPLRLLDASLAADAVLSAGGALPIPVYVPANPHTLDNLIPDMFNTAMVAGLGLMGAYVTKVRCTRICMLSVPACH